MIRTQVYIPEELHQAAKTIAGRGKEPMAEVLRRFIVKGVREEAAGLKQKPLTPSASSTANWMSLSKPTFGGQKEAETIKIFR